MKSLRHSLRCNGHAFDWHIVSVSSLIKYFPSLLNRSHIVAAMAVSTCCSRVTGVPLKMPLSPQLTAEAFQHVTLHGLHELGHASLGD